jgi:hypothetical protein
LQILESKIGSLLPPRWYLAKDCRPIGEDAVLAGHHSETQLKQVLEACRVVHPQSYSPALAAKMPLPNALLIDESKV